jgi:hypothetical protein
MYVSPGATWNREKCFRNLVAFGLGVSRRLSLAFVGLVLLRAAAFVTVVVIVVVLLAGVAS